MSERKKTHSQDGIEYEVFTRRTGKSIYIDVLIVGVDGKPVKREVGRYMYISEGKDIHENNKSS